MPSAIASLCLGLEALESAGRWGSTGAAWCRSAGRPWRARRLGPESLAGASWASTVWPICDGDVVLMTLPRMLGYVFNPVSFVLPPARCACQGLRREPLLPGPPRRPPADRAGRLAGGRKVFHVSPFLPVEGSYRFRFRLDDGRAHVDVNYHDAQGLMLATSVGGRREALTDASVLRRFLGNPTMTLAVIVRIHWQALHLQ